MLSNYRTFIKELEGEGLPDVPPNPEGPADRQASETPDILSLSLSLSIP